MKQVVKYVFYQIFCPLLLLFGIDKLKRRRSPHQRLIIMYHGVSGKKNFSINGRHLPASEFEKHLKYYKSNFDIFPLQELCNKNSSQKPGRRAIALTFDDGYLNNIQHAIPLLLKYKVPATFFISTISLTEREYLHPPDYIDMIRQSTSVDVDINGTLFHHKNKQLLNSNNNAYSYINSLSLPEFKNTLAALRKRYPLESITAGIDPEVYKVVSSETVVGFVSEKLFEVGSHSHDHINLTKLSKEELDSQLGSSKKMLETHTQASINSLAFPYGYFNEDVVDRSIQQGYRYLIAGGSVTDKWNQRVFPRIGILNMGGYSFNMLSINRGFRNFGF